MAMSKKFQDWNRVLFNIVSSSYLLTGSLKNRYNKNHNECYLSPVHQVHLGKNKWASSNDLRCWTILTNNDNVISIFYYRQRTEKKTVLISISKNILKAYIFQYVV